MPLGAFRLNSLGKFTVTAAAEVIRKKKGIAAYGNAQIDTAQSKFGGTSALFDGTGDYLIVSGSDLVSTGNGTIEFWMRFSSNTTSWILSQGDGSTQTSGSIDIRWTQSNGLITARCIDNATDCTYNIGATIANTWYHIAFVKDGSNLKLFVGGTLRDTQAYSGNFGSNQNLYIGTRHSATGTYPGWLDEIRFSKTARYTATFTAPTTRFTNDDNTLLLLHMDGTDTSTYFEDDNGVRESVTPWINGNVTISTTQSKFGGTSGYINASTGSNNALQFGGYQQYETTNRFRWGDYTNCTIESWVYFTAWTSNVNATGEDSAALCGYARESGYSDWCFGFNRTGKITLAYSTNNGYGNTTLQESTTSGSLNTWQHIAFVKTGTSLKLYVNGTERASGTLSGTVTYNGSEWFKIGQLGSAFTCYFDEFRFSNTNRYTGNFTAPTAPFVNDSNTILLLHANGTNSSKDFIDDNGDGRAAKGITAFGNAQIDNAQSKFGGTSAYFDGTTDYLQISSGSGFNLSGDFTFEAWVRYTGSHASNRPVFTLGNAGSGQPILYCNSSGTLYYYSSGANRITGSTLSLNTWYHLAVSRSGSSTKLFIDGTQSGSTYTDSTAITDGTFYIGIYPGDSNGMYGWIDEFRISNTARYTTNFTAPTAPFQNDANTLLLLHMDGTDASTVFVDDNGKKPS